MTNSRNEQRFAVNRPVSLTLLGSQDVHLPARVVDVSQSGLRLLSECEIPASTTLRIEWDTHFLVGVVRYLERAEAGFVAGVQLLTCSVWEPATYSSEIARGAAVVDRRPKANAPSGDAGLCRQCCQPLSRVQKLLGEQFCTDACRRIFKLQAALLGS